MVWYITNNYSALDFQFKIIMNMLSIRVFVLLVTLVGLLNSGNIPWLYSSSENIFVSGWRSDFNRSILKSPQITPFFFPIWLRWRSICSLKSLTLVFGALYILLISALFLFALIISIEIDSMQFSILVVRLSIFLCSIVLFAYIAAPPSFLF